MHIPFMTAGACFMEPEDGALRLVVGTVGHALDDALNRQGHLVQEYEEGAWRTVCPLTDAHFMLDVCPWRWQVASEHLRDLIESEMPVTLAVERAALNARNQEQTWTC